MLARIKLLLNWITCVYMDYRGDLKSELVWISNGQKEVGLQIVCILMGYEIWKLNHLKSGEVATILSKTI